MSGQLVKVHYEGKRGCGYRKPGGMYLAGESPGAACGRIPFEVSTCPCCGHGIKPSRGFQWVDGDQLVYTLKGKKCGLPAKDCVNCIIERILKGTLEIGKCGLIWIGTKHYPTTAAFQEEAAVMGLSRRINSVPNDFKVGETFVMLGHRNAILKHDEEGNPDYVPGVFRIWRPKEIQYVVTGEEADEELERLIDRGLTPVEIRNRSTDNMMFRQELGLDPHGE